MKKSTIWPIGITAVYMVFVLGMIVFVMFSITVNTDLVENDYYQKGLMYQTHINRVEKTAKLSQPLKYSYNSQDTKYIITAPQDIALSEVSGEVLFFRPSNKKLDKKIPLQFNSNGILEYSTSSMIKGLWRVKIFWNIGQDEYYNEDIISVR